MYTKQPKKLLILNILDILKRYTDAEHRLSQRDILELLETEYSMKADRKAIKRNLTYLIDFGYPLSYSESIRIGKNGEEEIIYTDWYMEHEKGTSLILSLTMALFWIPLGRASTTFAVEKEPYEIIELRTEFSKSYDNGDGTITSLMVKALLQAQPHINNSNEVIL